MNKHISLRMTVAGLMFACLAIAGCSGGKTYKMVTSSLAPASLGTVEARPTENKNLQVKVTVKYMAPPEKVLAGATTYVVWIIPLDGSQTPINVGALVINEEREGKLETITPHRAFSVVITAENSPTAGRPSDKRVLWTNVQG